MFGASLDTLRADDFRPGLAVPVAPKLSSVACRTAARGTRLAAPASGAESVAIATIAARDGGPVALGVAVAIVDRLANRARHRPPGNRHRLASSGLPLVLDVEESPPSRPTRRRRRAPRLDSDHV